MPRAKRPISAFGTISPLDYRYWDEELEPYLSESAFVRYKLLVECALAETLYDFKICSAECVNEIREVCVLGEILTDQVYLEEDKCGHDIRALVNVIRSRVGDEAKPYVHMFATSFDISDTANAARYRDAMQEVVIPCLLELETVLIQLSLREAETLQIGRTHGQHAVPITFGFAIAEYVSRLGGSIVKLQGLTDELVGKFSGAVGAYNASSLFVDRPQLFEHKVLQKMGLMPADHSTQIVQPEPITRLVCELVITAGVLANLADDMRHLQRTEIAEVGEEFGAEQIGSSTMPQKRNPINFENVKSMFKIVIGRITTVFLDLISEHQRDLTNSASGRTVPEIIAYVVSMAKRMTRTMSKLQVDHTNLEVNLARQGDLIAAEPFQILLGALGHPDAHEVVRQLTLKAQAEGKTLYELASDDYKLQPYLERLPPAQQEILKNPKLYTGIAAEKAKKVAHKWAERLGLEVPK